MKKIIYFLLTFLWMPLLWSQTLRIDIPAPEFSLLNNTIVAEDGQCTTRAGMPRLPYRRVTIALPADAVVESIQFHGSLKNIANIEVPPASPFIPLMNESARARIQELYENRKNAFYNSTEIYPQVLGEVLARGSIRKYPVAEIACYHFAYNPSTSTLSYTPTIAVEIRYRIEERKRGASKDCQNLKNDVTLDEVARERIFNWKQAREWHKSLSPNVAKGYVIILPASVQNAVQALAQHRQNQGYDVQIVTVEEIAAEISGNDLAQKIRNYLRQNLAKIQFVLLVGTYLDVPMRELVPFNNDPDTPFDDPQIAPVPSDFYYAELSNPDSLSWNSDGDSYYGEVYDEAMEHNGEDNPDYHADVHLGRIPYRTASYIEDICQKIVAFDSNTDLSYKESSLLAGGLIFFANENHGTYPYVDGADMMEKVMNESILDRSRAECLYEKVGIEASIYPCTEPLSRESMVSHWNEKGIVLEYNHGSPDGYWRKIWTYDDGDGIAENFEMEHPLCLGYLDVYNLDNEYPATTFLRSCLTGKPEVDGLGKYLLYRGASSVFCSTRVLWVSNLDGDGIGYHFLKRLMKNRKSSKGIIGKAFDLARVDFMGLSNFWMNVYLVHLYGDPALRQFGRVIECKDRSKPERIPF